MTTTEAQQIQPGATLAYNDGRPGHTAARAEVLSVSPVAMVVQFADRADTTQISFADAGWMTHLTIATN